MARGDTRCVEGRLYRHDPQHDDPDLETDIGTCPECDGKDCEKLEVDQMRAMYGDEALELAGFNLNT